RPQPVEEHCVPGRTSWPGLASAFSAPAAGVTLLQPAGPIAIKPGHPSKQVEGCWLLAARTKGGPEMKKPEQVFANGLGRLITRRVTARAVALTGDWHRPWRYQ